MFNFILFQMCTGDNDQQITHRQPKRQFSVFTIDC